jgi:hypothetical protein
MAASAVQPPTAHRISTTSGDTNDFWFQVPLGEQVTGERPVRWSPRKSPTIDPGCGDIVETPGIPTVPSSYSTQPTALVSFGQRRQTGAEADIELG